MRRNIIAALTLMSLQAGLTTAAVAQQPVKLGVLNDQSGLYADLTGMGSFLFMGLIGVVIASVVNLFLASTMLQFLVSVVGVLVFAGLTAYDTQRLKNDYIYGYAQAGGDVAERAAITGALSLYLNFINLFTLLLQLLGNRNSN